MPEEMDEGPEVEDLDGLDDDDLDTLDADDDDLEEGELAEADDDDADAGAGALEDDDEEGDDVVLLTAEPGTVVERPSEETEDEDEDEQEDEDVEASLDVILKERLVVEDEPDDGEPTDVEDRSELSERVLPKQPDEFVCRSCFLVKHPSQLADKKKMLCRDCV
jgi:Domain of unknown function (DUF4193)